MNYIGRQKKLVKSLESKSLDAFLVRKKQNISYLTGTKGEDAVLFVSRRENVLITDSRYKEEYSRTAKNSQLALINNGGLYGAVQEIAKKTRSRRIGFESNNFSYLEYRKLKKKINSAVLMPMDGMVEALRMIKEKSEVSCIKTACRYGLEVMDYALKTIRPSLSEAMIKQKIESYIIKKGIQRADFDIIVASGKNASMPHGKVSKKHVRKGEMVVIDLGAMNYGYNSDLTRTVFLGKINRKYSAVYKIVSDAQKRAIENIRPGVKVCNIDTISRQYISDKGLGKYFIHSLGHGIGLEPHERPSVSKNSSLRLEKNMTITIEPGVYIPGWGGVRVEDVVLVTEDGCEVLTS